MQVALPCSRPVEASLASQPASTVGERLARETRWKQYSPAGQPDFNIFGEAAPILKKTLLLSCVHTCDQSGARNPSSVCRRGCGLRDLEG